MENKPGNYDLFLENLAAADINVNHFANLVISDSIARKLIIDELLNNNHISVYYNCHLIIVKATEIKPGLFYEYWSKFTKLLYHKNSYHRNYGLIILANLIQVDKNKYFVKVLEDYFNLLDDEKFTTAKCCMECAGKIILAAPQYADTIFNRLLLFIEHYDATTKRKNLLRKIFYSVYLDAVDHLNVSAKTETRIKEIINGLRKP